MKNKTKQSKFVGPQIGGATQAKDAIINIVQNWFKSGAVLHLPGGGSIRASDVNETVLVPKDDGSILGNLTFYGIPKTGNTFTYGTVR